VNLKPRHRGCVASIGNFDGVHRGHQAVLYQLREKAQEFGLPSTVVVFEPMPLEFFATTVPPARLMRCAEKCQALAACGVDRVLCLHFNRALADLSPDSFIDKILLEGLGVRYLVVGDDFRFGKQRSGDRQRIVDPVSDPPFDLRSQERMNAVFGCLAVVRPSAQIYCELISDS